MIKFLVTIGFVLVFLFVFVLIGSLMLWVVMRIPRSLFPKKFSTDSKRDKDEV